MNPIMYLVSGTGIAFIIFMVYLVEGAKQAELVTLSQLKDVLKQQVGSIELLDHLFSEKKDIALANLSLKSGQKSVYVIYSHGTHLNVRELAFDKLQKVSIEQGKVEKDDVILSLTFEEFDRSQYDLHLKQQENENLERWIERFRQLAPNVLVEERSA